MLTTEQLTALARGQLSFNDFAAQARGDFTRLAQYVAKGWRAVPTALDDDDLVQEMLLAVYQQLPRFEEGTGCIREFVVFRACAAARRALKSNMLHRQLERGWVTEDVQEPYQEARWLARELAELVPFDERQRTIVESLAATGSLDVTTQQLLAHPDTAAMFANHDHTRARHSVYRTARKLAERAQAAIA